MNSMTSHRELTAPAEVLTAAATAAASCAPSILNAGTLPLGAGHDRAATYALLHGDGDDPAAWLQAGEALSALRLAATALEATVLPLSDVVVVPGTLKGNDRMRPVEGTTVMVRRAGSARQCRISHAEPAAAVDNAGNCPHIPPKRHDLATMDSAVLLSVVPAARA